MRFQRFRDGWNHNSAGEEMEAFDPVLTRVHAGEAAIETARVGDFTEAALPPGEGKRF